jgi:hypothetical protein
MRQAVDLAVQASKSAARVARRMIRRPKHEKRPAKNNKGGSE